MLKDHKELALWKVVLNKRKKSFGVENAAVLLVDFENNLWDFYLVMGIWLLRSNKCQA